MHVGAARPLLEPAINDLEQRLLPAKLMSKVLEFSFGVLCCKMLLFFKI